MSFSLLGNPFFYNSIRKIIAGDQEKTKAFVKKWLKRSRVRSIVDVGCGTGDFFDRNMDVPYMGIDINPQYISFAKKKYKTNRQALFLCVNLLSSGYLKGKQYDGVIFVSMMHHFSDEDIDKIFNRIKKFKPKVIVIADIIPDPPGVFRKIIVKLDRGSYIRSPEEKLLMLKQYFRVVHSEIIYSRLAVQFGVICKL